MKKVLITAGPTQEAIDPVRFITNHSSGKMGYSLAEVAQKEHDVILISGPVHLSPPSGVQYIQVTTAEEMFQAVMAELPNIDVLIMTAAVADYRPVSYSLQKIKKSDQDLVLELERTKDILAEASKRKSSEQIFIGFSAESENLIKNAQSKLVRKGLDWIVANDISRSDIGFGSQDNQVTLISKQTIKPLPKMSKTKVAEQICALFQEGSEENKNFY
jgi:phosphopantothenoylcysteine decarboxylase/phosphopantothenate--cysteine ligase